MADIGMNLQGGMLQRVPPSASRDDQIRVINDMVDRLNGLLKTQVFSDGANKRMLIGYQKDGWGVGQDFGIKVSLPGIDVAEATDEQLLFRMATDNWAWRNTDGDLVQEFDIANGVIHYRNSDGNLVKTFDINSGTEYEYNPSNGKNFMQTGRLPDGSYGWAVADVGKDVSEGF